MAYAGTRTSTMKRVLSGLSEDTPIPIPKLAKKLKMHEYSLRRALHNMEELGLVKKERLPTPSNSEKGKLWYKRYIFGWRKCNLV